VLKNDSQLINIIARRAKVFVRSQQASHNTCSISHLLNPRTRSFSSYQSVQPDLSTKQGQMATIRLLRESEACFQCIWATNTYFRRHVDELDARPKVECQITGRPNKLSCDTCTTSHQACEKVSVLPVPLSGTTPPVAIRD
jgi:hypothetical protein